jgi:TonB family protein
MAPARVKIILPKSTKPPEDRHDSKGDTDSAVCLFGADRTRLVLDGKIPTYPQIAVAARVSGSVTVNLSVVSGVMTNAQVVHADNKLLIESTLQNVRTWRFGPSTNVQIATEFVYEIAKTESGSS